MNTANRERYEQGQALIQVTLSLAVLLGFVAMAIDVGRVYSERRSMQNAADAAALAGARELCLGHDRPAAISKGEEVLRANGVATDAASGAVTVSENIVTAVGRVFNFSPIIGQLIAWDVIDEVGASASAACGAATSACGLWPMAVQASAWNQLSINTSTGACVERTIAIWNDDEYDEGSKKEPDLSKIPYCMVDGEKSANLCDCYQCPQKDGKEMFYLVASEGRAWLDFSSAVEPGDSVTPTCTKSGGGTSELNCQILRNSILKLDLPRCVEGIEGVRASSKKAVNNRAASGAYVKIPLFDNTTACEGKKDVYNVTSFGCASPVGWYTISDLLTELLGKNDPLLKTTYKDGIPPKTFWATNPATGKPRDSIGKNEKIILAKVSCSNKCATSCGSTNGTAGNGSEVRAVSLIK